MNPSRWQRAGISADMKERIFKRNIGSNTGPGLFLVQEIHDITGMSIRETGVEGRMLWDHCAARGVAQGLNSSSLVGVEIKKGPYRMKVSYKLWKGRVESAIAL